MLLDLIDGLPRDSRYVEALSLDPHLAELMAMLPDQPAQGRRMSEYSAEMEMLTAVYDRLGEVMQVMIASKGGKPKPMPPGPRPRTALDRVRRQRRERKRSWLRSKLLPDEPADG